MRNKPKNNTKESYQTTRKGSKRRRKEQRKIQNNQKTVNKRAISTYLLISILNVNGLNSPIKKQIG